MGLKGKAGLAVALILLLAAILTPLEYAPAAFVLLMLWVVYHHVRILTVLAASIVFCIMIGLSSLVLGFGLDYSVLVSFRAITFILPMYVYFSYSSMQELMETLESFGVPRDFSFMVSALIPYSHVLERKVKFVNIAQQCRGSRSPWAVLMPLLNFVFERARMLAISIECRGWSAEEKS